MITERKLTLFCLNVIFSCHTTVYLLNPALTADSIRKLNSNMSQSVIDKGETLQCVLPDGKKKKKCNSGVKKIPIQLYFPSYLGGVSQLMILCLVDKATQRCSSIHRAKIKKITGGAEQPWNISKPDYQGCTLLFVRRIGGWIGGWMKEQNDEKGMRRWMDRHS